MGTPAPGPPPRTAPAPPRPAPCAPGARRGRRTRPRAQLGADRSRHPEADEAPMQPTGQHHPDPGQHAGQEVRIWPTSSGSDSRCTPTLESTSPNRRKQDMRMLSRPLAPRGQEAAAFAKRHPDTGHGRRRDGGRPGGVATPKRSDRARSDRQSQQRHGAEGRPGVADQPAAELPTPVGPEDAAVGPEGGAAVPAEDAAPAEAADNDPAQAPPDP